MRWNGMRVPDEFTNFKNLGWPQWGFPLNTG